MSGASSVAFSQHNGALKPYRKYSPTLQHTLAFPKLVKFVVFLSSFGLKMQ